MFILIVSSIVINTCLSDWVLVDSSFLTGFTSANNWLISKSSLTFDNEGTFQFNTCSLNSIKYALLKRDQQRIDQIFIKKSYQSEVIVDIFFDDAESSNDKMTQFTINYTISSNQKQIMYERSYINSALTQNARRICNSTGTQYLDFFTVVGTSQVQQQQKFNISIGIENINDIPTIGIRNLFVYVKYCQPTCKTCSSSTSCLTCDYGAIQTDGSCTCDPSHQFAQTGIGCRQECERDYFIARSDNICVPDRRIKSNISYFESATFSAYTPFQFIQGYVNLRSSPSLIFTCSSNNYVGSLLYNEGMSLQFANSLSLKFIRLRITFYMKGFQTDNKIQIILDDQIQGEIIKASSSYTFNKITKIYSSSVTCTNTYDLIRIEAILRTFSNAPKLIIKGQQLTQVTSIWGFRNITIDSGNCQENCAVCSDFSTCQQCDANYVLFQNGCVTTCPVHSTNCIDYADMIPNSRYLAKGFYNLNMSTSYINQFFDETVPNGSNFLTGQIFSIFPTKFVLGGVMVWNNAIYKKSWSISKPHYAVTIRFNVTYGDEYNGNFYYTIQGVKSVAHPKPSSGGQNFIGKSLKEITQYFEIFQNQFTSSPLNIEFQCTDTTVDPIDQFCAISDYFIVVHYCLPFCQDCNDGTSCVTWESGYTNQNCNTNQFLQFDSILETYSCITCNQPGCLTCKNLEECTSCDPSSQYNTLINGVCVQINTTPPPTPSVQCHQNCETCTGALITNCQTCVSDFHRTLSNNECLCQPGFYDDGINVICLPACGDLVIVEGEDCDDGNIIPYDGCFECKFQCQDECNDCRSGICYGCAGQGWHLINHHCEIICGDNIVVQDLEECDDGNYNPYDGCNNCKLSCDDTCKECFWGTCFDCQKGFQIMDNLCVAICGDNLLVKTEECEDNNQIPNDGCYNCKFSCPNNCIDCQFNNCIKCDEQNGWYLKNNTCQPICGDGIIAIQFEQCDEINQQESKNLLDQDFCLQCLYKCQDSCSTCQNGQCYQCNNGWILNNIDKNCYPIEGDRLVVGQEQCDDGNQIQNDGCFLSQYQYPISCEQGFQGLCQKCISGFFMINNICQENNFDGLVIGIEQCDDQNLIGLDGCFQNRFDCPQFCLSCVFGNCLECDQTSGQGQVDYLNNRCLSICGDGIKSMDEQCDDGNEIPYDGCYGCLYECQKECNKCVDGLCYECLSPDWILKNNTCECETCQNLCQNECLSCIKGVCYECQSPEWILDSNNICVYVCGEQCSENICGDGILNMQIEECDDGNDQIRDGCYNCLLEKGFLCYYDENMVSQGCSRCQDFYCLKCDLVNQSQICSDCLPGYFIDEFKQCQQCDLMCVECSQNYKNCTTVNPQYTTNQQNQQKKCNLNQGLLNDLDFYECVLQCGNGVLDPHEQCDDGNREIQDGCNEFCQLEEGYLFDHLTHSLQKEPSIQVEKKQSNNNQFSLLINQYQESLNVSTLTVSIEGFQILDYNYSVIENNNQLDLNFTYKKTIEPINLIHISISYKEYYKKRQLEETINKEIIIVPQKQVYVTEEQKIQGEAMAQTYQTVFQAQIYLAPLAIAFGGFQFFLAILDIMSWMNNFYFLNVNYPENVRIIFQQAEWSNIINIPSLNLFNKPTDDYYFQAPIKFVEKEIDPLLFNNIQTPIIFAFQVVITYFLSVMIIKIFELIFKKKSQKIKIQPHIFQLGKDVKHEESTKTQQLAIIPNLYKDLQIPKSLQSFYKNCVSIKSNLIANLIRSFAISYLDITLAVILQITNQQTAHELIVKINIIAAYGFLILVLYLLNISYQISNAHHIKLNNKLFFQRYSCFYEEMKTESQTAMAYSFLNLIRKTIFIFSTVILYSYPIFQTLLCFLSCLLNILLLLSSNPFKNKKQYILNLVPDFCIILILGSANIFAFQDRFKILQDESIYQIGWVVGISIYLSIGLQLFFLIYEIMLSFWQKLESLIAYLKNKCTQK